MKVTNPNHITVPAPTVRCIEDLQQLLYFGQGAYNIDQVRETAFAAVLCDRKERERAEHVVDVKTCKTCAHYRHHLRHPMCNAVTDPVNGGPGAFCEIERQGIGHRTHCGSAGTQWEPRPARRLWWKFWVPRA